MSKDRPAVLALDIGGTKLAAGVVRADGEVLSYATCPTGVEDGPEVCLERLFGLGRRVLDDFGGREETGGRDGSGQAAGRGGPVPGPGATGVLGTGIGCGGPLDPERGVLVAPPHLPGWRDVPITQLAEKAFESPAVLDNDGTAGAAGQWRFGAGRGTRNLLYLTVSTGIGGGMVIDGRTYRGAAGNGGEPGHVTVRSGGRRCRSCGREGCLEAYASGTSIAERAREAGCAARTAEELAAAVREGDPLAVRVWEETTELFGGGLTSIVNLLEPELVVLGGGVTRSADLLLPPLREYVARSAMGPAAEAVRIETATGGERAGLLGAAAIGFERLDPERREAGARAVPGGPDSGRGSGRRSGRRDPARPEPEPPESVRRESVRRQSERRGPESLKGDV